jgi:hypothetical protein
MQALVRVLPFAQCSQRPGNPRLRNKVSRADAASKKKTLSNVGALGSWPRYATFHFRADPEAAIGVAVETFGVANT